MEISARPLRQYPLDPNFTHEDYEVVVDGHRILTLETHGCATVFRWLFDSVRRPNTRHDGFVVGLAADREYLDYTKRGVADTPYDLLEVCIGSHCLLFHVPDLKDKYNKFDPTFLRNFFGHQSVTVVGVNMKAVAEKLDRDLGIKIRKWLDLNELAVKAMRRDDLDLGRYDLDRLARTVLGKRWDVVRDYDGPTLEWYDYSRQDWYHYDLPLSVDKVKFATVDTYLCFSIGTKLMEMVRSPPPPDPASSSQMQRSKKKTKNRSEGKKKNSGKNKMI